MYTKQVVAVVDSRSPRGQDRKRWRHGVVTQQSLRDENVLYASTCGVSQNNQSRGYKPAYLNTITGVYMISRFANGSPAPVHVLDGLPESWIEERDQDGHVTKTCPGIVSGFLRDGHFYTREEALMESAQH